MTKPAGLARRLHHTEVWMITHLLLLLLIVVILDVKVKMIVKRR